MTVWERASKMEETVELCSPLSRAAGSTPGAEGAFQLQCFTCGNWFSSSEVGVPLE